MTTCINSKTSCRAHGIDVQMPIDDDAIEAIEH